MKPHPEDSVEGGTLGVPLRGLTRHLAALATERHPHTSPQRLAAAEEYAAEVFQACGLAVERDPIAWAGRTFHNVLGHLPGDPHEACVIIGAHLDTVVGTPGADDNASGVAVLLETARLLALNRHEPGRAPGRPMAPVIFAGYALEEVGMVGSCAQVAALRQAGAQVAGMLSLEMVGFTEREGLQRYPLGLRRRYPATGDYLGLVGNWRSRRLLRRAAEAMRTVPNLPVETVLLPGRGGLIPESRLSDHAPFWDAGYPALLVTDTAFLRNPHYHQATDTVETLDLAFLARVTEGVVTAVRRLSGRE